MPEQELSDQQARDRIRDDLDATLFVEAGAGTGKTHELIERIVRLVVTGRTELRNIAAITFTEAAAAELRDRIRERLEAGVRDGDVPAEERERYAAAISEIDAAAIETLHGFAQRILAEHPLEAGLPPTVEIQDEIQASIAFDERWAVFLEELLQDASMEDVLLRAFTLRLDAKQLREVATVFQQHWDRLAAAEIPTQPATAIDVQQLLSELSAACDAMPNCTDQEDGLYQHLQHVDLYRQRLAAAETDLDRLGVLAEPGSLKTRYGKQDYWQGVKPADLRDILKSAQESREETLRDARAGVLPALLAALRAFILEYADERRRAGRLEFHDLLVRARDLLHDNATVRKEVREQFSHLLIDEFQDTDPLQIEIAVLLAGEDDGGEPKPWQEVDIIDGRLFFVGDPKQSIYRFRRADIELYKATQRHLSEDAVRLTQNFRSLPSVIDWVNDVFGALMGSGDAAGQVPYEPLQASRAADDKGSPTVRVLGSAADGKIETIREHEAAEIARLILTAKSEGWPVSKTESGTARFADIALLMPTRTTLPPIEQALGDAGIPYRVESRSLVFDTQEVRDLLSILRAVDDPTDQVALVAALRSPAFACGDDDLLRYQQAGGRWDYRPHPPGGLEDNNPVAAAMESLHGLHRRRWWETISGIVEAVIRERRLFELAFATPRPRERWQRLRFILDQSRAFAEAGGRTLRQFIDWAERQAEEGTRVIETAVPEPDDDAVRIMTVHAAKGLEFPIVVLAGLNVSATGRGRRGTTVLWNDDGRPEVHFGSDATFETPGFEDLSNIEQQMEREEKDRLLYVAATRARDHLVVSLHHKTDNKNGSQAARLQARATETPHLWQLVQPQSQPPMTPSAPAPFEDSIERRDAWLEARESKIERMRAPRRRSATEIASAAADVGDDPNLQKDTPVEEKPPWRRGRAGTALGRAVHAVLQSIDLATGAELESTARAQAAAEGIAHRSEEIARMARAAIDAPSIREAVKDGTRYWRELFVSAQVDGTTVEGFVDLLYETPEGLVVVDYKTDVLPGVADLDKAVERYRLQGAAYALALQEALGRHVARCVFVFVQPRVARERAIGDLSAAILAVRESLKPTDARTTS